MKDLFLKILLIIDYQGDKEDFVEKLLSIINDSSLKRLVQDASKEKQQKFIEMAKLDNADTNTKNILNIFTQEEIDQAKQKTVLEIIVDYLRSISPALNEKQKASLTQLFSQESLSI